MAEFLTGVAATIWWSSSIRAAVSQSKDGQQQLPWDNGQPSRLARTRGVADSRLRVRRRLVGACGQVDAVAGGGSVGPYEDPELPHGTKEAKMEEFFCVCVTLLDLSCLDESSLRADLIYRIQYVDVCT